MDVVIDLRKTAASSAAPAAHGTPAEPVATPDASSREIAGQTAFRKLDGRRIAFITCVNDEEQYGICRRYIEALEVPAGYDIETLVVLGAPSMARGYQAAQQASSARYKLYLHQDVYLVHRRLLSELLRLFHMYPRLGMVGVVGATRLPANGVWFVNNPCHCYGQLWEYRRGGGPAFLLGRANRRRLRRMLFRSFSGDYMPAVTVDGLLMGTQYDLPWDDPLGGFELYEQVHALKFIRAGLEVGIARQPEATWCIHWGPLQERPAAQLERRSQELARRARIFRQLYWEFLKAPALELLRRYDERSPERAGVQVAAAAKTAKGPSGKAAAGRGAAVAARRERLGVAIVTFNGLEVLRQALQALVRECAELAVEGVDTEIVVVDNASTDGTVEAVRQEFPWVTVVANRSNGGPARGFNLALRTLGVGECGGHEEAEVQAAAVAGENTCLPDYLLIMNNDVKLVNNALVRMLHYLREHEEVGGVVASLTNPDGSQQFQRLSTLEIIPRRPRRPAPVTFAGTTCLLVRGQVLWDVGLFDERFYFFNEDLEWSLRAKRRGHRFVFLPEARVIHFGSMGMRQNRPAIFAELPAANLWFFYKHAGSRWATVMYWAQRLQARWQRWRHRHQPQDLARISEAMRRMDQLYAQLRQAGRTPNYMQPG